MNRKETHVSWRMIQAGTNRGIARDPSGNLAPVTFRRKVGRPLPGDTVAIDAAGAVARIDPRKNHFGRGDSRGLFRPLAANLDQVLIVIAARPAPSPDLLHRYLAAAHIQGIPARIVVNKCDLPTPDRPPFDELDQLSGMGYSTLYTQCHPRIEIDPLATHLEGRTSLLAGQSGVGKSSLLNALLPDLELQTGSLSSVTGKGTHTTTSATLYQYGNDGWLVDTPGVWEFGLWQMPAHTLQQGFPEFSRAATQCRFRDCLHQTEPNCGVRAAVTQGDIPQFRHTAWLRLLDEQRRIGKKKM
ncbi:ribosome small subunit-dependent GTPase A [Wenzhouxiangella sp. AB-CW3]|uniref:ribosome small subunit-dependent GTPase A n=1 Tax=Wenzhouxiangella sp. AB-CW3 TaxID=2771012 RepID=UPI00168A7808|nr:ribosome small subunit-dependent GTPase A [Wenzhouxiangella sp. AB-CW3]QOC21247.1 ribosome small subunit-dependent GTPase A [Wenzhouxiangella sp. AB-CW3]